MTVLLEREGLREEELPAFAAEVVERMQASPAFVLWLEGGMGAGKTTFTRAALRSLGLNRDAPVTSPTYTLFNEYTIAGAWYGHLDLYRAGADFILAELGVRDVRDYAGLFVEWPGAPPEGQSLVPTHRLEITVRSPDTRDFVLVACDTGSSS